MAFFDGLAVFIDSVLNECVCLIDEIWLSSMASIQIVLFSKWYFFQNDIFFKKILFSDFSLQMF